MEIDSAARACFRFMASQYWRQIEVKSPHLPTIIVLPEQFFGVNGWMIEIDAGHYSTMFFMNHVGEIQLIRTTVVDKYDVERHLDGMPSEQVLLGQVAVF